MNKLLEVNRELREIPDPRLRSREFYIRKIMDTYGYDRENAEKAFEYMKYKRANYTLGLLCGPVGAIYARPIQHALS